MKASGTALLLIVAIGLTAVISAQDINWDKADFNFFKGAHGKGLLKDILTGDNLKKVEGEVYGFMALYLDRLQLLYIIV